MLDHADYEKLNRLMEADEDFRDIIEKLMQDHRFTLSAITHEIRNTLTLISSSLQLIEETHPETALFQYWKETLTDVRYLRVLLEELSSFNKSGVVNKAHFLPSEMFCSLEEGFRAMAVSQGKHLTFRYKTDLPFLCADRVKLRQVITNLLKNALEATEKDGWITLEADFKDDSLYIKICDNGCGIPAENLQTIFVPFSSFKKNGTGLGLPIARQIIEAHGGTLSVKSSFGRGSCFTICLPAN